jgi:hypothetical protein
MKISLREIEFGCVDYVHLELRIGTGGRIIRITGRISSFHCQSEKKKLCVTDRCCVAKTHCPLDSVPYDCGRHTHKHAT